MQNFKKHNKLNDNCTDRIACNKIAEMNELMARKILFKMYLHKWLTYKMLQINIFHSVQTDNSVSRITKYNHYAYEQLSKHSWFMFQNKLKFV